MGTAVGVVASLEKIQEESRPGLYDVLQEAAIPKSTPGNTMAAIGQSRSIKATNSLINDNSQPQAKSKKTLLDVPLPDVDLHSQVHRNGVHCDENGKDTRLPKTNKRDRCDDSEDMNEDSYVGVYNAGGDGRRELEGTERRNKKRKNAPFEVRYNELTEFLEKFGHCNVPQRYPENPSLGSWCHNLRMRQMKKNNLAVDRLERLDKMGFRWKANVPVPRVKHDTAFDERVAQLTEFKNKFGHCNVNQRDPENLPLGRWCKNLRIKYRTLQQTQKPCYLSEDRIERLTNLGFKFSSQDAVFDMRVAELTEFKNEFGHCHVPYNYAENISLGSWCTRLRNAYRQMQKGQKTKMDLSGDRIECLENDGATYHNKNS